MSAAKVPNLANAQPCSRAPVIETVIFPGDALPVPQGDIEHISGIMTIGKGGLDTRPFHEDSVTR